MICDAEYPPVTATPRHPPLGKEGKARIAVERVGTGVLDRPENSKIHGRSTALQYYKNFQAAARIILLRLGFVIYLRSFARLSSIIAILSRIFCAASR